MWLWMLPSAKRGKSSQTSNTGDITSRGMTSHQSGKPHASPQRNHHAGTGLPGAALFPLTVLVVSALLAAPGDDRSLLGEMLHEAESMTV
jgi:hypothetical protein